MKKYLYTTLTAFAATALSTCIVSCIDGKEPQEAQVEITQTFIEAVHKYDYLGRFTNEMAVVCKDSKWGYINVKGEEVIPCKFISVGNFSEGLAIVEDAQTKHCINKNGEIVFSNEKLRAFDTGEFKGGFTQIGTGHDKNGFLDKEGNAIIPCKYYEKGNSYFSEGLVGVGTDYNKFGFLNEKGEAVIPFKYYDVFPFSEGLASVVEVKDGEFDGEHSFIDHNGNVVLSFGKKYVEVKSFSEGMAAVAINNEKDYNSNRLWGFINKSGEEVIPTKFYTVGDFVDGIAYVTDSDGEYYINTKGETASPKYVVYEEGGKKGIKDATGNILIEAKYSDIDAASERPIIKNGVVAVSISDNRKEEYEYYGEGDYVEEGITLYGYADMNGNDTFTQDDYDKINEANQAYEEEKRIEQERLEEMRRNPSKLFKELVSSKNYAWANINYPIKMMPVGDEVEKILVLSPETSFSGIGNIFYFKKGSNRTAYYQGYSHENMTYTIEGNILCLVGRTLLSRYELKYSIEYDGSGIRLLGKNGDLLDMTEYENDMNPYSN